MTTVTLKMPQTLERRLRASAEKHQTSRSELIRTAVLKYIDEDQSKAAEPSAYDCVREFSGTVEGPCDLSANPRHMEGYGK
jgi:metal-responsive CopG/Arc/MetJ family transcriptional regulator